MSIRIELNPENNEKELYIFDIFMASWDASVDDMKVIVPYAIEKAAELGGERKLKEIRNMLGCK